MNPKLRKLNGIVDCADSAISELEDIKHYANELYEMAKPKTKGELIKEHEATGKYRGIDSAVPQEWIDDVAEKTGIYPLTMIAWAYPKDGNSGGEPLALTEVGGTVLEIYNHIVANG